VQAAAFKLQNTAEITMQSARQLRGQHYNIKEHSQGISMLATMLTGAELLAKVKELGDASKSELVKAAGYLSTKKDGTERLNYTAFYEALLEAKGMNLGERSG
jgi:hypothetical protein